MLIQVYLACLETKNHVRTLEHRAQVLSYTDPFTSFTNFIQITWPSLVKTIKSNEARGQEQL